jgi:hypothetical protein
MKKGEMSGLAKTGIGVGAAVGALFILMLLGSFVVSIRKQTWFGVDGVFSVFARRRARTERRDWTGGVRTEKGTRTGVKKSSRSTSRGGATRKKEKGKEREKVVVEMREKEPHVVWV